MFLTRFSFSIYYFRVVAIDMRGYNLSERPVGQQNYEFQYMVDDLRALIEHLGKCIIEKSRKS